MIQTAEKIGSITQDGQSLVLDVRGLSSLVIEVTGTFVATLIFEYTINGTDWYTLTANTIGAKVGETGATTVGKWIADVAGYLKVRVRCSAFTSGTVNVVLRAGLTNGGSHGSESSNTVNSANTPSIATGATALAANPSRKGWMIQNVGTNPLFVLLGDGASATVFHAVLKGGTGANDGLGGSLSQMDGVIYTGKITVAGTSPSYVVTEL